VEYLVPIVVVAIVVGLLFVLLRRRPTVVQPPTSANAPTTGGSTSARKNDDAMQQILTQLNIDVPSDGKAHVQILKGKEGIGWTVTRRMKGTSLSSADLAGLEGAGNTEQLARQLLAKLAPGSVPSNAPPEAELHYPGSSPVLNSFDINRTTGTSAESRDVYKTTLATEAESAEVLTWYRDWLLSHGWQPTPSTGTTTDSSQAYARGSEHFRLAVADPAALAPVLAVPIPAGTQTVYEVEYSNSSTQATTTP
jgi:hypothetical protein